MCFMKHDLMARKDIEELLLGFYDTAFKDPLIGFYFTQIAHLDLETHLPVIADFWENIIFSNGKYKGNAIQPHQVLHRLSPFQDVHFDRWVFLFTQAIDQMFEGPNAELAKQRAQSIATVMKIKIIHQNFPKP